MSNNLAEIGSSTKEEPEQRLDFIFVGGKKYIDVISSSVEFDQPVKGNIHLSDHYGVKAILKLK